MADVNRLSCSVCLEEFKMPKVLPCGHTFCMPCISRVREENHRRDSDLKCPKCRKRIDLPASGVESLPTNYEVLDIINRQARQSPDRGGPSQGTRRARVRAEKAGPSKEAVKKPEPECQLHNSPLAEFYCKTCSESVCAKCLLDGHKPEDHRITTKAEVIKYTLDKLGRLDRMYSDIQRRQGLVTGQVLLKLSDWEDEKRRLERQIDTARYREMERINRDADRMLQKVERATTDHKERLGRIERENNDMQTMAGNRKQQIVELTEEVTAGILTNFDDIENIDADLEPLLNSCDEAEEDIQNLPTKIPPFEIQFSYDSIYTFRN